MCAVNLPRRGILYSSLGLVFMGLMFASLYSQPYFQHEYSGPGNDFGISISQTPSRNFILGVNSNSYSPAGDQDLVFIKVDSLENLIWARNLGTSSYEFIRSTIITRDSGIVILSNTMHFGPLVQKVLLTKLDQSGNLVWSHLYDSGIHDRGNAIVEDSVGNLLICGTSNSGSISDMFLLKTDPSGNLISGRQFGTPLGDKGYGMVLTDDGGVMVCGDSFVPGHFYDLQVIKLGFSGNLEWSKTIGSLGSEHCETIGRVSPGHYVIGGYTLPLGAPDLEAYLVSLSGNGTILRQRVLTAQYSQQLFYSAPTSKDRLLFVGYWHGPFSNNNMLALSVDSTLNVDFTRIYPGVNNIIYGNGCLAHSNGDLSFIGTSATRNATHIRIDSIGNGGLCPGIAPNYILNDPANISGPGLVEIPATFTDTEVSNSLAFFSIVPSSFFPCPIPIVLPSPVQLYAKATPSGVQTQWQLPEFPNVARIDLIRQSDNGDRQLAAQLFQPGRSDLAAFDPVPGTGRVSYQLEILMLDGEGRFSNVVSLQLEGDAELRLSPNPYGQDRAQPLVLEGLPSGATWVELLDLSGKVLWREAVPVGVKSLGLALPGLSLGMYFVRVGSPSGSRVLKLLLN